MKYKTIYADPPWMESGGGKLKRGADRHYPLMKTKDIMNLPVSDLTAENCHLYLWVTNNFLQDGLKVMKAWGFKYKTMITWLKGKTPISEYIHWFLKKDTIDEDDYENLHNAGYTDKEIEDFYNDKTSKIKIYDNPGLGQYFRGNTESCLFGVKGNLPYKTDKNGKRLQGITGFIAPRTIHSRKPQEMRMMIERVSYPPYLELFARQSFPNWDHWGNELNNDIEMKKD